ncbi:MAG TPA: hypothetical protein VF278_15150 [Pirellulales bacterium]
MRISIVVVMSLCANDLASAQQPAVVQLPSVSTFGVNTSVSVPDRGSVSLGGVGRSSRGSNAFGPGFLPGNRSFGSSLTTSNTSVHATIHDFDALDRETLAKAQTGQFARRHVNPNDRARRLALHRGSLSARESSADRAPEHSVADARRRAIEADAERAEALANVKRARASLAAGKANVAAMFYKVAAGHAAGELRRQIENEAAEARASRPPRVAHFNGR